MTIASRRRWLKGVTAVAALGWRGLAGAQAPAAPALVQAFGPRAPARVERVFAAGPPAAVLIAVLAPDRLLGWPTPPSDAARALLPPAARDKPVLGRLSGRGSTIGLEALLALKPDLVLDAGTIDATYASTAQRVAEQTGLPYLLVDGRLADTPTQLRQVGALLGVGPRAQALATYAEEALGAAAAARTGSDTRPGIYLARGADGLETALAGSINAEFIEAAGGRNVARADRGNVARVSLEQVLGWAPDWVVTQDRAFYRQVLADPVWRAVPAVRDGRVLLAPDLPYGWLDGPPGINRLLGVRWLAAQLAAGRPAPGDAIDQALRFYPLFYGVTPRRETLQAMLDGRG